MLLRVSAQESHILQSVSPLLVAFSKILLTSVVMLAIDSFLDARLWYLFVYCRRSCFLRKANCYHFRVKLTSAFSTFDPTSRRLALAARPLHKHFACR